MEQFKTLEDLGLSLLKLERWFARPVPAGEHPTLFLNPFAGRELICGIQREDYLFSLCGNWILPSDTHGLSFSARWRHLKGIHKLKSKHNPGKAIAVYWILEKADLPPGLAFVPDPRDAEHYVLAATCGMHVTQLREKLIWVADRMSVIKDAQVAPVIEYRFVKEKQLLLEYAAELHDAEALAIVSRGRIDTADEARALGKFYWRMVDASVGDDIEPWHERILVTLSAACRKAGFEDVWDEEVENA